MNSDDDCVCGALGVDHGQPDKARPRWLDQTLTPAVYLADRYAVQHHGVRASNPTD